MVKSLAMTKNQLQKERSKTQQQANLLSSLQAQVEALNKKWQSTESILAKFSQNTAAPSQTMLQDKLSKQLESNMDLLNNLNTELAAKDQTIQNHLSALE